MKTEKKSKPKSLPPSDPVALIRESQRRDFTMERHEIANEYFNHAGFAAHGYEWLTFVGMGITGVASKPWWFSVGLVMAALGTIWWGDAEGWWHLYLSIGPIVLPPH